MLKKKISVVFLLILAISFSVYAQEKTVVNDAKAKQMLSGKHKLSLQWISWDYFGTATVTQKGGVYYLKGSQLGQQNSDYLKIDGKITEISAKEFKFNGKIAIKISYNNNGEECLREGEMTFKITGKRKYWRLMEMDNPCEGVTDYVDIYFK
jgi:hypothetical protein